MLAYIISNKITHYTSTAWGGCADLTQADAALSPTHSTYSTVTTFTLLSEATNNAPNFLKDVKVELST